MKKPTVAELLARIEVLEQRVLSLEMRPVIYPYVPQPAPYQPWVVPTYSQSTCRADAA